MAVEPDVSARNVRVEPKRTTPDDKGKKKVLLGPEYSSDSDSHDPEDNDDAHSDTAPDSACLATSCDTMTCRKEYVLAAATLTRVALRSATLQRLYKAVRGEHELLAWFNTHNTYFLTHYQYSNDKHVIVYSSAVIQQYAGAAARCSADVCCNRAVIKAQRCVLSTACRYTSVTAVQIVVLSQLRRVRAVHATGKPKLPCAL
eukprot:2931-Heterococcus_DN1.PRE.7